ncbi:MAG TPA: FAD:protein FMN transferase [Chloroflexia bacterium]|nr:FAD:protein FMN transferase [Chloroflexia bacterium]
MNTEIELILYPQVNSARPGAVKAIKQRAEIALGQVKLLFSSAEERLSRFKPESELSRLNREGHLEKASLLLYESVQAALEMAKGTEGIYDPTILNALEAAGYNVSFELIGQNRITSVDKFVFPVATSYKRVTLDPSERSIRLAPGTKIDLGGIAKGMTVDRAAALLHQAGFTNFVVSAGGDMYVSGSNPRNAANTWKVGVLNPFTGEGALTELVARDAAVATSAVTKRRWMQGGKERNHLIDPRSGQPVDNGIATVSVVAPAARLADVFAKTALILGLEEGPKFIEKQPGCSALFVTTEGRMLKTRGLQETSREAVEI